jgi:Siphovirus Gp157
MSAVEHRMQREAHAAKALLDSIADVIADDDDMALDMIGAETGLTEALDATIGRLAEIEAVGAGIAGLIAKLKNRADRLDAQAERLRGAMCNAMDMASLKKFEGKAATVSMRAVAPKVIITNEADLPSEFLTEKTTIQPDKKNIGDYLKKGGTVRGAELSNGSMTVSVRFA